MDEDDEQQFDVLVRNRSGSEAKLRLLKSGGRWKEKVLKNPDDMNVGGQSYMSYLTKRDVIGWLKKDFEDVEEI